MAEPIPCPTCGSLLRLPEGASAVRCPKCQTVLTVAAASAPTPATTVPPPAAAPLPIGRAKAMPRAPIATPAKPVSTPPPEAAPRSPNKPLSPYDAKPEETGSVIDPEEQRRQVRKELKRLEREKEAEAEWLAELELQCRRGRLSLHLISWAIRCYLIAVLLQMAALVGAATGIPIIASMSILGGAFFAIIASMLFLVGFGFSIAAPPEVKHLGIMGLVVSLFHLILGIIQPGNIAIMIGFQGLEDTNRSMWHELLLVQDILGLATDFPLLADHPARFLHRYNFSIPGILVAAAEFTRLVIFSMLALSYARGGKHPEHGHNCMKAINRIFWIVLLAASFRLAFSSAFDNLNKEDMIYKLGLGAHWSITLGTYISLMVLLLVQSQQIHDTIEVIDHRYWADKRDRLDML